LVYDDSSAFKKFAVEISKRRLQRVEIFKNNKLDNIRELLGEKQNFDADAADVAKGDKQFGILSEYFEQHNRNQVIEELSNDEKLLEMYNILLVVRGHDYRKVGEISRRFIKCRSESNIDPSDPEVYKYYLDYTNKYRLALLYLLYSEYGVHEKYYSFNTFVFLSSGSINDFISLCRNTFRYIDEGIFNGLKNGKPIPSRVQTDGAFNTALDQARKLKQSNNFGNEMYCFIDNLGSIFERYHKDRKVRYPETNQFAFTDENAIMNDDEMRPILYELISSGALIKKKRRQRRTASETEGTLYQISRIYAPIYRYSYRTRGGVNYMISPEQFETMLKTKIDIKDILKDYHVGYKAPANDREKRENKEVGHGHQMKIDDDGNLS